VSAARLGIDIEFETPTAVISRAIAMPAITAVIPVLNRAHAIGKALGSILSQDLPRGCTLDIVVVDDGSTDDLDSALHPFGTQVKCIKHDGNKGAGVARNTGIAAATGDYLAFLDSDDVWLPNKIVRQIAFMTEKRYVASCTACSLARPGASDVVWPRDGGGVITRADLVWGCFLSPGTTMICERSVFNEIGPFDPSLKRHEDWDWLLRFTGKYNLAYLGVPLARREPSPFVNRLQVLKALEMIRAKHLDALTPSMRRQFEAAIACETAAAYYREGDRLSALLAMIKSLWLAPVGHPVLSAIIANRFARS
jgi:glycosyltransferase involved in cell wall biosynthesis